MYSFNKTVMLLALTLLQVAQCCNSEVDLSYSSVECKFFLKYSDSNCSEMKLDHCSWKQCVHYPTNSNSSTTCGAEFTEASNSNWSTCMSTCCDATVVYPHTSNSIGECQAYLDKIRIRTIAIVCSIVGVIIIVIIVAIADNRRKINCPSCCQDCNMACNICQRCPRFRQSCCQDCNMACNICQRCPRFRPSCCYNQFNQIDCNCECECLATFKRERRVNQQRENFYRKNLNLTMQQLARESFQNWKIGKMVSQQNVDCSICLSQHPNLLTNCHHWFHPNCFSECLKKKVACALCRNQDFSDFQIYCLKCLKNCYSINLKELRSGALDTSDHCAQCRGKQTLFKNTFH